MKKLLLLISMFSSLGLSPCLSQSSKNEAVFIECEIAHFNNGDLNDFLLWVYKNLKYPNSSFDKSISGQAIFRFMVDSIGMIKNVEVLRSASIELDNEAKRVIESSPKWLPGSCQNKNKENLFTMPVKFSLTDKNFEKTIKKLERQTNKTRQKKHNR